VLGLDHNFVASTYGRGSVMDYFAPRVRIRADGTADLSDAYMQGVGSYDRFAIEWGYSEGGPGISAKDEQARLDSIVKGSITKGIVWGNYDDPRWNAYDDGPDQEIRIAVNQMTELIDSLLEFSRTRESLRRTYGSVKESADRVVQAVRTHPRFHTVRITVRQEGNSIGWFDTKKLERVLYNLLLNACEATSGEDGRICIDLREVLGGLQIRVSDNGRGIPESIRGKLFEPFISHGKENGTGLGLTVVQKIVQDHGGDVIVEQTSDEGTVFRITLPIISSSSTDAGREGKPDTPPLARAKRVESE
jgi:signal transduction histidine kinase